MTKKSKATQKKETQKQKAPAEEIKSPPVSSNVPPAESVMDRARDQRHKHLLEKMESGKGLNASERNELAELERRKSMPAGCVGTQKDLAAALSVGERTIPNWIKQGMPRTPEGYYNILEISKWHEENIGTPKTKRGSPDGVDWENEYRKTKAQQALMDLQKNRGELIEIEEVQRGRILRIQTLKNALLALPSRVAPRLEGLNRQEIRQELTTTLHEMIKHFSGQSNNDEGPADEEE